MYILHPFNLPRNVLYQWISACFAVILLAGATASYAQNHTLTIREGQVYVNGKQLQQSEIPPSLNKNNVDASFSFPGNAASTFQIGDYFYRIENNKLLDVTPLHLNSSDEPTTVIFRKDAPAEKEAVSRARSDAGNVYSNNLNTYNTATIVSGDPNVVMQRYVFELKQNARQLNEMSASLNQRQAQDLIQQVQYQAEQASQLAQDLPYLEMQQYFSEVRSQDELLYQRLVSELELERETQRIAAEIRQLPAGDQRDFKLKELREMLSNILALKQENRKLEINQLEKQLDVLRKRFDDREEMKDRIINQRIVELIGNPR